MAEGGASDEITDEIKPRYLYQRIGFVLGPALGLILTFLPTPEGMSAEAWTVVALAAWMATWWATEAIPVPATSLLPLIFLPLAGITSMKVAAQSYAHPVIMLLLGGFIIAMAMQRWNLHKRLALMVLVRVGERPDALILGFMISSALLSMWISNTATTLMMIPIALSVAAAVAGDRPLANPFTVALLLSVAYSSSIGGLGTIVGTPPNLLVVGYLQQNFGIEIGFAQWMMFGVPVVLVLVPTAWFVLTRWAFDLSAFGGNKGQDVIRQELADLGSMSVPEQRTAILFAAIAGSWMFRPLLADLPGLGALTDTGIAIAGAVAMFVVPAGCARDKNAFLLDWGWAVRLPWGVILLFGGGLSLAATITSTGLAGWLGNALAVLTTYPLFFLMLALVALVIFLTELTSNTAMTAALLPVLGAIAGAGQLDPVLLAIPAAMAASCAFMLPVATAPNAIIFGDGHVTIPDMVKAGFRLNLVGIFIITLLSYALVPLIFG